MKSALIGLFVLMTLILAGCGGGGGGSTGGTTTVTLVGRILDVSTGAAPATKPSIQTTSQTVIAGSDGSFSITAPKGATSVVVDSLTSDGTFTYTFAAATATTDLGDLWIGPEKITVTGRLVDSTNGIAIGTGTVNYAGRTVSVGLDGKFTISQVAYDSTATAAFLGIVGTTSVTDYYTLNFTAGTATPTSGVLSLGDLLLTPTSDPNPPSAPYSITGVVKPLGTSSGTVVTLKQSGTAVRIFNVGSDGKYWFWAAPGSYTITYAKGSLTAPTQSVTVQNQGDTVTVSDVTLQ